MQMREHHGVDLGRVDARGGERLGERTGHGRPRGCRAVRRTNPGVHDGEALVAADRVRAELEPPAALGVDRARVIAVGLGPLGGRGLGKASARGEKNGPSPSARAMISVEPIRRRGALRDMAAILPCLARGMRGMRGS